MAIGSATVTFREGQLPVAAETTDNVIVVYGYCTLGTAATLYTFQGAAPSDVITQLGYGPLAQLVAELMATPGHGPVVAVPCAATAGVLSAVVAAGTTPPTVTLTGNSVDEIVGRVEILSAGARGTATFRYCLDYDSANPSAATWSNPIVTAATYLMDNSGVTLNFAVGTYATDNVYTFSGAQPAHSDAQITAGMDAVYAAGTDFGIGYVLARPRDTTDALGVTAMATTFAAVSAKVDTLEASGYKYTLHILEAPRPIASDSSGLATWRTALTGATAQALAHKRMAIGAGYGRIKSVVDQRTYRRPVVWRILQRLSIADISEKVSRVDSGPLPTLLSIEHDEGTTGGLGNGSTGQRYLTCRTWAGKNGFYAASDPTFASVGSDYSLVVRLRVVNRGAKVLRNGLLRYVDDTILADSTTGKILETEAQHIDEDITQQLVDALQNSKSRSGKPHVSSVSARVNRTDAILTTSTLTGTAAIQPAGYATAISFTIGFTGATVSAAA